MYGRGSTKQEIVDSLYARYGISVRHAKGMLVNFKRDSQGSIFYLSVELGQLVSLAHLYMSSGDQKVTMLHSQNLGY